jgi:hypothetical protein
MRDTVSFSSFNPLFSDAPARCDICESKPSVFQFESHSADDSPEPRPVKGFCCASCATLLLDKLQREESLAWAEEEASFRIDEVEVSDFHQRRLATFGTPNRS